MNECYVFVEKNGSTIRIELYGSVRIMCKSERIIIGDKIKSEVAMRKILKACNNKYMDEKYHIQREAIKRSTTVPELI
jgi:hypothetical protein